MKVAIIPARGGSKRIPRKNIKLFHGKPLIAYSIDAARQAGCFDRIIVSTEDAEIGDIAKNLVQRYLSFAPVKLQMTMPRRLKLSNMQSTGVIVKTGTWMQSAVFMPLRPS